MSSNIIVTEILLMDGCKHGRVFRVPIDPKNEVRNYKSRTAINAFFHSCKDRNYKKVKRTKEILYHSQGEWEYDISVWKKAVEIIDMQSVWEFFDKIGYNNKTKKWI